VLALSLAPSLAAADEPTIAAWAQQRVEEALVKPLVQRENSSFSRSRPPPRERRVRVLAATTTPDKSGHGFLPFAIDVRFPGGEWREGDVVGCVYAASGKMFVKRGDAYRPAAFLLGRNEDPVADVCVAAPARS
jgi:hypothetical protein